MRNCREEKGGDSLTIFWWVEAFSEIGRWLEECREDGGCEKCVEGECTESKC